jgi:RimJ/RimL family protein N-acetyltransferase
MVRFEKARLADTEELAEVSKRAFDHDIHYGAPGPGGPPGYDSPAWQAKVMRFGDYYKISDGKRVIGGMVIMRRAAREYEVGRIFIEPEFQDQGIGTEAFEFLWEKYSLAKRWTLDTPAWNLRTRHFYEKVGFVEIGKDSEGCILFERRIQPGALQRES